jgi:hypothetical protein
MKFTRSFRLLFVSMFVMTAIGFGTITASAATSLSFVGEPANAGVGAAITTTDFNVPAGGPVTVQASAGQPSVTVTLCLQNFSDANPSSDRCPSPLGDPGFEFGGTTTRRADRTGLASFGNLTVAQNGEFVAYAKASGATPDTSVPFRIYDDFKVCANGSLDCNKSFGDLVSDQMSASVAGQRDGTAVIGGALDLDAFDCGDIGVNSHAPHIFSFFVSGIPGAKTVVMVVAASFDKENAENGSAGYRVCFVDDSGATPTTPRLLPNCSPSVTTDCVQSINKRGNSKKAPPGAAPGDVIITVVLADGRCF